MPSWKADHVRVTLFNQGIWPEESAHGLAQGLGYPVESTTSRPSISEHITTLNVGGTRRIELKAQLNRIDITMLASVEVTEFVGLPLMDDLPGKLDELIQGLVPWIQANATGLLRVAIGCAGYLTAADKADSYRKVAKLLPNVSFSPGDSDFQLRLNKPIQSAAIHGLQINVIGVWASLNIQAGAFGMLPIGVPVSTTSNNHYVQCVADVNTAADRPTPLPADQIANIVYELRNLTVRLIQQGTSS